MLWILCFISVDPSYLMLCDMVWFITQFHVVEGRGWQSFGKHSETVRRHCCDADRINRLHLDMCFCVWGDDYSIIVGQGIACLSHWRVISWHTLWAELFSTNNHARMASVGRRWPRFLELLPASPLLKDIEHWIFCGCIFIKCKNVLLSCLFPNLFLLRLFVEIIWKH